MSALPLRPPLIGVTTSEVRLAEKVELTPQGDPPDREMALGMTYLRAIERADALPVVMPPLDIAAVQPLLDRLSGVCLSGGPDLDPVSYGGRQHPELGPTERDLDEFELAIAAGADARGIPILAICRGEQALNVARGGTLLQHLPERHGSIAHRQSEPGDRPTHAVAVDPESLLARILGRTQIDVNSFHHQAVDRLGDGLRAVAWAPDGVVEGIEALDRDFVVGVQWHAEGIIAFPEQSALFSGFIAAAQRYDAARAEEQAA